MKKSALVLAEYAAPRIYGADEIAEIRKITDLKDGLITNEKLAADPSVLNDVEIMFSGWGGPVMDAKVLAAAPKLEAIFYGAGSIRYMVTPEFWARNIPITSVWYANGIPVAEYVQAQIILSLKKFWQATRGCVNPASFHQPAHETVRGAWKSTVGLVSLGMIGRLVAERMKTHDVNVIAYDPFVTQEKADAQGLGVRMVSLEEVFATADVVSLHTPNLPETRHMITGGLIASMKPGSTFINTARGAVVDENAMIGVLRKRPDLFACIDVTDPEPPVEGSPLYTLPNVVLSPHIAGAVGDECRRLGHFAVAECERFLKGEALKWQVTEKMAQTMA
ncbi:MAG: hydroxyacid dehydrogenase [Kiritimatiellaeota bacterium]|nr:hydroxyacid dehydrogenase [Kiritimatiellota bacterium]